MVETTTAGRLCRLDDIPDGGATAVEVDSPSGGFSLILLRDGEAVRAFHNECPHAGRRLDWAPGKFLLKDRVLVCAAHGASFDAGSGACLGGPCRGACLAGLPVRVEDGEVKLR
ncbi:MAG: Rieske 2Fe-2S domain-containing protein [Mizugakiibacter sp.]|uniref:Rieske (2Fe-2S) protein n=1 Tax=Mizugakiibacter sp. TaxID=1972610 RepID=UPI0031C6824B|nr:Rieske 2Fe-2S domain-containing protein [Xanthomonadaceae bacterium]